MRLPNKVTTYQESIISLFPIILFMLSQKDSSTLEVYEQLKRMNHNNKISIGTFIQVLDCLHYLGKIELKEDVIHYVG